MQDVPYGYCHCGCGKRTRVAVKTNTRLGIAKGDPQRFIQGHNSRKGRSVEERLLAARQINEDGCWIWTRSLRWGYGHTTMPDGRQVGTQRAAYLLWVGPVPEGLELDHLCRNRACFNPEHLEPVTHAENCRRGAGNQQVGKTHCPQGHPYNEENTMHSKGRRYCRTCGREHMRRYRARKKAQASLFYPLPD